MSMCMVCLLLGNPPGAGVQNGQFVISRGFRGEQPDFLPGLDGISLIPVSVGAALEGVGCGGLGPADEP